MRSENRQTSTGIRVPAPPIGAAVCTPTSSLLVRRLGLAEYGPSYAAMRQFTTSRQEDTPDELWILQHPPVYTAGLACRPEHLPRASNIPLERIDRGGQITYHGPGQVVLYTLLDLTRRKLRIRALVSLLEQAVINTLARHGTLAQRAAGAPGVYVDGAKVAALGLRVRSSGCYHGLALNVDMDLAPFHAIDPCGYPGLAVTQTRDLGIDASADELGDEVAAELANLLERHELRR